MLADNLRNIASNFSGTHHHSDGPSASFIFFVQERATRMAINGHKSMVFSMNDSWWDLDTVKSSLDVLTKDDGFITRIDPIVHQLEDGEEALELVIIIEWK